LETILSSQEKFRLLLSTPPLTEPEENALVCEPTVRMMGTVVVAAFKDV